MNINKEILKYCPNYYNIVNFDFDDSDVVSEKLVGIYKNYIFSVDINNKEELEKVINLDNVLANYIHDYQFRTELQREIVTVRVKNDNNVINNLVDIILNIFVRYEEYTTRKIYISRWI